jgi:hypothetical protein
MPESRKRIIGVTILVIILMGIVPPWTVLGGPGSSYPGVTFPLGYHPIFMAPIIGAIDVSRLVLQWILAIAIGGATIYLYPVVDNLRRQIIDRKSK